MTYFCSFLIENKKKKIEITKNKIIKPPQRSCSNLTFVTSFATLAYRNEDIDRFIELAMQHSDLVITTYVFANDLYLPNKAKEYQVPIYEVQNLYHTAAVIFSRMYDVVPLE